MFVPVQDNYLAIYPFYCFWFFKPFLKMNVKEFSFSCVSLFNYQGSCRLTASIFYHIVFCLSSTFLKSFFQCLSASLLFCDSHTRLSHLYLSVKNFFKLFSVFFDCFAVVLRQLDHNIICFNICQHFFVFLFFSFFSLNSNFDIISSSIYYVKLFLFDFYVLFI